MQQVTSFEKEKSKLASKWQGRYVIKEEIMLEMYVLVKEDGKKIKNT